MQVELPSGFRQRQAAARPVEQADPEFVFQGANAAAEFGRLHTQSPRGAGEACALDHLRKKPKVIEIRDLFQEQFSISQYRL